MWALRRFLAIGLVWQSMVELSLASGLATVSPCPECGSSIAPAPVTITAQYQTISTCTPSTTTVPLTYTKRHTTGTTSTIKTIAKCSDYAWVSTTIPAYDNGTKVSTVVTTTDQPVTFNRQHFTETHTTVLQLSQPQTEGSRYGNATQRNTTTHAPSSTTQTSFTTIDIKSYCDYDSMGPLAISGYSGSGLCTDCGPDASSALTQRFTVVSCSDSHCTTFNETWIASPKTYHSTRNSQPVTVTVTTTNTYCPTATPETAMPGYGTPSHTGSGTSSAAGAAAPAEYPTATGPSPTSYAGQPNGSNTAPSASPQGYNQPSGNSNNPSSPISSGGEGHTPGAYQQPTSQASAGPSTTAAIPTHSSGSSPPMSSGNEGNTPGAYPHSTSQANTGHSTTAATPTHPSNSAPASPTPPQYSNANPNPAPTNSYDNGNGNGSPDPSADPSGDMGYDPPAPTPYHRRDNYKIFKRQGLEKPRGKVMRRSGLLFWGV